MMTRPTTTALVKYFLYLGSLGFGGPVALVGYMQRDLVEQRGWFTKDEYMKSLALSQLAPGPLAAQLAICLGYVHSRVRRRDPRRPRVHPAVVRHDAWRSAGCTSATAGSRGCRRRSTASARP